MTLNASSTSQKDGEQYVKKLRTSSEEGKQFAKQGLKNAIKAVEDPSALKLVTPDQKNEFDANEARKQMLSNSISVETDEVSQFLSDERVLKNSFDRTLFDENEAFILQSEKNLLEAKKGSVESREYETEYTIEKCFQQDAPYQEEVKYSLDVQVTYVPEVKKICKICKGHKDKKKHYLNSNAKGEAEKQEKKLAADPSIKKYQVKVKKGDWLTDDEVRWTWEHHDDVAACDAYVYQERVMNVARWEEEDSWKVDDVAKEKLVASPQCTYLDTVLLETDSTKIINSKPVFRNCWGKVNNYLCRFESKKCEGIERKNCIQTDKKCINNSFYGCTLWEITFKCLSRFRVKSVSLEEEKMFGANPDLWDTEYTPSTTFSEALTKLKVLEEVKKELENSQYEDITRVQIFKGKKAQCSKSVTENLMYDCCFAFKGLANTIKLSKCTSEEIALAELRDKGQCHYIGSYDEKFHNLWTSRKEHVFCCFPSKLSRVFQEAAREQLGIDWGKAECPDCRGLTQEELSRLNLSQIDLSEAYEVPPDSKNLEEKAKLLEERLKQRIGELACSA